MNDVGTYACTCASCAAPCCPACCHNDDDCRGGLCADRDPGPQRCSNAVAGARWLAGPGMRVYDSKRGQPHARGPRTHEAAGPRGQGGGPGGGGGGGQRTSSHASTMLALAGGECQPRRRGALLGAPHGKERVVALGCRDASTGASQSVERAHRRVTHES